MSVEKRLSAQTSESKSRFCTTITMEGVPQWIVTESSVYAGFHLSVIF